MPVVSVYASSKTAIEGFTGSLAFELEAFNSRQAGGVELLPRYALRGETLRQSPLITGERIHAHSS